MPYWFSCSPTLACSPASLPTCPSCSMPADPLVLLTLILLAPPRGDDLDVGEAGPETPAQVPRPGEIARPDGGDTHDGRILLSHLGEDFARQGMRGARLEGDG